jgi:hypothetical protein
VNLRPSAVSLRNIEDAPGHVVWSAADALGVRFHEPIGLVAIQKRPSRGAPASRLSQGK